MQKEGPTITAVLSFLRKQESSLLSLDSGSSLSPDRQDQNDKIQQVGHYYS